MAAPPRWSGAVVLPILIVVGLMVPLVSGSISAPGGKSLAFCVNPPTTPVAAADDSFVTVPISGQNGDLYTFDSTSGAQLGGGPITVGVDPVAMAIDTTYSELFVLNKGSDTVSVINYASGLAITGTVTTLPSGAAPVSIAVSPGGAHIVVADAGTNQVSVIDPNPNDTTTYLKDVGDIGGFNSTPADFAFAPDADTLYVGDTTNTKIDVFEYTSTSAPFYTFQSTVSGYRPSTLATSNSTLYVGDAVNKVVDVFTMGHNDQGTGTLKLVTSYPVPNNPPAGLAVTTSGTELYVSSNSTSFLEINTATGAQAGATAPNPVHALSANSDGTIVEMADQAKSQVERWAVATNTEQPLSQGSQAPLRR